MSLLDFLNSVSESNMPTSAKMVRDSLRNGTYSRAYDTTLIEGVSELLSISMIDEPNGKGVSVICDNGVEYRYAPDENHPKYNTPELLLKYAKGVAAHHSAGVALEFINRNSIQYVYRVLSEAVDCAE